MKNTISFRFFMILFLQIMISFIIFPADVLALRPVATAEQPLVNRSISDRFAIKSMPSYKDLKTKASNAEKGRQLLSAREFFQTKFDQALSDAAEQGFPVILVYADHLDIDSFVSTLSMTYLLYQLLSFSGQEHVRVIPVIHGSSDRIDRSIRFVADKVFDENLIPRLCFSDSTDIDAGKDNVYLAQVDSSRSGNWLVIDHHQTSKGIYAGEGSRIEKGPSAAFFIYQEYLDAGLSVDISIAWITLYAILSDTLNCTENMVGLEDIHEAIIGIILPVISLPPDRIGALFEDFSEVIYDIKNLGVAEMLDDTKLTYIDDVAVSQKFFYDYNVFAHKIDDIVQEIKHRISDHGPRFWIYIGTDIVKRKSYVFAVFPPDSDIYKAHVEAVFARGGKKEGESGGIGIFSRPEMLRKQLMENTQSSLDHIALKGESVYNNLVFSTDKNWFESAGGIFAYAYEHRLEFSWANIVYSNYSKRRSAEFFRALKQLLLNADKNIRTGAAWILSRPEFIGTVQIAENLDIRDKTLSGVLSLDSLSDNEVYWLIRNFYNKKIAIDKTLKELFFCQLNGIIMHEHDKNTLSSRRAVYILNLLKNHNTPVPVRTGLDSSKNIAMLLGSAA
jgi:inorganic pyrophosphatase/exopolyphosphatase